MKVFSKFPRLSLTLAHLVSDFLALHTHPLPSWGNWEQKSSCHITSSLFAKRTLFRVSVGFMHVPRVYSNPKLLDFNLVFPLPLNSSLCYCRSLNCQKTVCQKIQHLSHSAGANGIFFKCLAFYQELWKTKTVARERAQLVRVPAPKAWQPKFNSWNPHKKARCRNAQCNPALYINVQGKDED